MMVLRMGLLVVLSAYMHLGIAQTPRELAWADSLLEQLAGHMQDDARRAAELARQAAQVLEQGADPCKALHIRSLLANYLDRLGSVDSAAALFLDDRFARIATCPPAVQKDYYRFLTNVQLSLGEFMRVDSVCTLAYGLADAGPLKGMDLSELRCNHGIAVANMGRLEEAMTLFRSAYDDARAHASTENMTQALLNMATIHAMQGDLQAARKELLKRCLPCCATVASPIDWCAATRTWDRSTETSATWRRPSLTRIRPSPWPAAVAS
ncbi:MAG: hypothetical protein IPK99_10300 [Flavobacteriales bacterium]|nr:hypothetical protein [Flavobacteriales bacterium]